MKLELFEARQSLTEKDMERQKLKHQSSARKKVKWDSTYYWLEEDERRDGPFCQYCHDSDEKLNHLIQGSIEDYWECRICGNGYKDKAHKPTIDIDAIRKRRRS